MIVSCSDGFTPFEFDDTRSIIRTRARVAIRPYRPSSIHHPSIIHPSSIHHQAQTPGGLGLVALVGADYTAFTFYLRGCQALFSISRLPLQEPVYSVAELLNSTSLLQFSLSCVPGHLSGVWLSIQARPTNKQPRAHDTSTQAHRSVSPPSANNEGRLRKDRCPPRQTRRREHATCKRSGRRRWGRSTCVVPVASLGHKILVWRLVARGATPVRPGE